MSKKKIKSSAAENLIETLMDDLKDIQAESSYQMEGLADDFVLPPDSQDSDDKELVAVEFNGGFENPHHSQEDDDLESSDEQRLAEESVRQKESQSQNIMIGYIAEESFDNSEVIAPPSSSAAQSLSDGKDNSDDEATRPVNLSVVGNRGDDKTVNLQSVVAPNKSDVDKTVAVEGFAKAARKKNKESEVDVKVSIGSFRGGRGGGNVLTSVDASLIQAENLKLAQQRILELEKENEQLRGENEELASAAEIIRSRNDEFGIRITALEKEKLEIQESGKNEALILKGNLQYKENEIAKARIKIEELEARLKSDFKKIRVRERELENRLELLRAEKSALVRSKDEYILEQKRKIDHLSQELDNYRKKCLELNKTIEANQDQVKRTERALRLALTNLEAKEESSIPLKKAE